MPPAAADVLPSGWERWPLERKRQLRDRLRLATFQTKYRYDPAGFARDCIEWPEGEGLTPYQEEILRKLVRDRKLAVRGPHGLGKTAIAAIVVHWFALTRDGIDDWKAPTTASVWRQLVWYLWPEIEKWARRIRWDVVGRPPYDETLELQTLALKLSTGSGFAVTSDDAAAIEGAHADQMLYVYDEGKTIRDAIYDASEGAFSGAGEHGREAYALVISTPGEPVGRFYDIHARKAGYEDWSVRHVTVDEAIAAGRISGSWMEQRRKQWGEGSALFANRVLGEFAATGEQSVIPLAWIEAAQERWRQIAVRSIKGEWILPVENLPAFTCSATDVADTGDDNTVIALRYGDVITELRKYPTGDTMETTGRIMGVHKANKGYAVVDVIGIGAGVVSRLREQSLRVEAFNASEKSDKTDRSGELEFANRRAEAWWGLREELDPSNHPTICLPPDDEMTGDLTAPRWKLTSSGKILIESKDDIRKRLGRSTDVGDGVVMAFAHVPGPAKVASAKHRRSLPRYR